MSTTDPHAGCPSRAWQQVTCDRCGVSYQCTPWSDFYCAAGSPDHCCEACLVGGRRIAVVDPAAPLAEPVFREPTGGAA